MERTGIRRPPILLAWLVAGLASLFVPETATAALVVTLEPASGPPGIEVRGRTVGQAAFSAQVDPLPTSLVERTSAGAVKTPADPRLVEIGVLVVDPDGNGRITFRVPTLDPGDYAVMVFCEPCAPTSAGRTMLPVAGFRVTSQSPSTDTTEASSAGLQDLLRVGAIAALTALTLVMLRRRLTD